MKVTTYRSSTGTFALLAVWYLTGSLMTALLIGGTCFLAGLLVMAIWVILASR